MYMCLSLTLVQFIHVQYKKWQKFITVNATRILIAAQF